MSTQLLTKQGVPALDAWARLLRGHAALRRTLSADLQTEHGLTVNEYEALLLLYREDEEALRRVDLAERLQLTASGVTRMLDRLEGAGLVGKDTCATDARVTYATLTPDGRRRLEQASGSHLAAIRTLLEERYSDEELATLAELLGRLPGAAGANPEDCGT
jgi:DNA-binding MarR family transcriptional regulator